MNAINEPAVNTVALDDVERTRCEVWTRVMGYHRPVSAFNAGKQAEHRERLYFCERPSAPAQVRARPRRLAAA